MIFIVTGMHRSGTSMIAGLLHGSGINMGSEFRKPLPENPNGFYEDEIFRSFNDKLLEDVGYYVKKWNLEFNGVRASTESHSLALSIIERHNRTWDMWGWKDPRTCLTLKFWLSVIESASLLRNTRIIVVERQIRSISKSLRNRGNISSLLQGANLCRLYWGHLESCLSEYSSRLEVIHLKYERVLRGLDLDRLESFCGLCLRPAFIDLSLDHSGDDSVVC